MIPLHAISDLTCVRKYHTTAPMLPAGSAIRPNHSQHDIDLNDDVHEAQAIHIVLPIGFAIRPEFTFSYLLTRVGKVSYVIDEHFSKQVYFS